MSKQENYLTSMKKQLNSQLNAVVNQDLGSDTFVSTILEELRGSFTRGLRTGKATQKTRPQKKTSHYKS